MGWHLALMLVLAGSTGCGGVRYLAQAAWGQLELTSRAEPIEELLASGRAPPRLAGLLADIPQIKSFGQRHGLAVSGSYGEYAELDREAAVWVVTACEALGFEEKEWWFPIVGSVPYLGWFDARAAKRHGRRLAALGLDVHVRKAGAYSTLGWFDDPILSTMLTPGPSIVGDLVNTVLHESAHATLYVDDQSTFNESLASFVADRLTPEYLRHQYGERSPELHAYLAEEKRRALDLARIRQAYESLSRLYASARSDPEKQGTKAEILADLQAALGAPEPYNNARLVGIEAYHAGFDAFADLLDACGGSWVRWWAVVGSLDTDAFGAEQEEDLDSLLNSLRPECLAESAAPDLGSR